jgi:xyloglucan-specific exo-beta-1,4-glucanase
LEKRIVFYLKKGTPQYKTVFFVVLPIILSTHPPFMKKKNAILLLLLYPFLLFSQTWQPLPMYGGGFITDVILHPTDPSIVVGVCDVGGIFISTDDCQTWTSHTANVPKTDFKNFYTRSFAFDPITPNTQYFVSGDAPYISTGKIWKTTNNGASWTPTTLPVNISGNNDARFAGATILINPLTTNKLIVGGQPMFNYGTNTFNTDGGLAQSTDGGISWTKIGGTTLDKTNITKLKFAPNDPSIVYFSAIATAVNGVPTTGTGLWTYNTTTTTLTQLTTNPVLDFDFDAASNSTIITTSAAENRVSTDGGTTWTTLTTPSGLQYGLFASAHPTQGGVWYFGTFSFASNTIVTTSDGGANWAQVKYSGTNNASKIVHPTYLATNDKPSFGNYMACLVIRSGKAYLSDWYGVWRTPEAALPLANTGQPATNNSNWTWTFLSQGIHNMVQVRTSLHPTDPNRFYANVADLHYYESTNAGISMSYTPVAPMNMTCRIDFHKDNPLVGYMCGTQGHGDVGKIFKTTNGGTSWNEIAASTFNGGAYNITDLQLTPAANTLIIGIERHTLPSQVYRSNDGGTSWTAWDNGLTTSPSFRTWEKVDHLLKDADGETFYIFRDNKCFRRKLTDAAWTELAVPIPANWISGVQTSRTTAGTLYLAQYTTNIYKSTNNGTTWTPISTPSDVGTFAISPNGSNILFQTWSISDEQLLQQSQNGGTTWTSLPTTGFWGMMSAFTFLNNTKVIGWSVGNSGFSTELAATLPVELVNFSGNTEGSLCNGQAPRTSHIEPRTSFCSHVLNWETASEIGTNSFEIQQLMDDNAFKTIGTIKAKGEAATYTFTNEKTAASFQTAPRSITYYRLKINETGLKATFSKTISLENAFILRGPLVYPNPATDVLFIENADNKAIEIVNVLGQTILSLPKNMNHSPVVISHLKGGIYFVKIGGEMVRFIKN